VVLAGGLGGKLKTGRHLAFANRSHNDLFTTILNLFGGTDASFGHPAPDLNKGPLPIAWRRPTAATPFGADRRGCGSPRGWSQGIVTTSSGRFDAASREVKVVAPSLLGVSCLSSKLTAVAPTAFWACR